MIVLGGPKNGESQKSAHAGLRLLPALGRDGAALWAAGAF